MFHVLRCERIMSSAIFLSDKVYVSELVRHFVTRLLFVVIASSQQVSCYCCACRSPVYVSKSLML
jgi:hypothetical protein